MIQTIENHKSNTNDKVHVHLETLVNNTFDILFIIMIIDFFTMFNFFIERKKKVV